MPGFIDKKATADAGNLTVRIVDPDGYHGGANFIDQFSQINVGP
jgi:hypothetical protein